MARFRGMVHGAKGPGASRLGHQGITVKADGWDLGVRVCGYKASDDRDGFEIWITGGSNGAVSERLLGFVRSGANGPEFEPVAGGCPNPFAHEIVVEGKKEKGDSEPEHVFSGAPIPRCVKCGADEDDAFVGGEPCVVVR